MYWGANVRTETYVLQAKIHGPDIVSDTHEVDELIEFVSTLSEIHKLHEEDTARFYAEKIAKALFDHEDAKSVTVDVFFSNGHAYGHTEEIHQGEE